MLTFSDHFWTPAVVSGTLVTLALFMLLPNLRFSQNELEEPVIVIDFMQWREPKPLPKSPPKQKPIKPKPIQKPRQVVSEPKEVNKTPEPVKPDEPVISPDALEKTQTETEQPKPQQEPTPVPQEAEPVKVVEDKPDIEALPTPVPLFKLTSLPRFVHKMEPDYPPDMRALGKEALVKLEVLIDRNGKVRKVTVLESGGQAFDQAASSALQGSSFVPGNIDGQPVAVRMRIPIKFSLR